MSKPYTYVTKPPTPPPDTPSGSTMAQAGAWLAFSVLVALVVVGCIAHAWRKR